MGEAGLCGDGVDNDCDGSTDEDDAECSDSGCTDCESNLGSSNQGFTSLLFAVLLGLIAMRRRPGSAVAAR